MFIQTSVVFQSYCFLELQPKVIYLLRAGRRESGSLKHLCVWQHHWPGEWWCESPLNLLPFNMPWLVEPWVDWSPARKPSLAGIFPILCLVKVHPWGICWGLCQRLGFWILGGQLFDHIPLLLSGEDWTRWSQRQQPTLGSLILSSLVSLQIGPLERNHAKQYFLLFPACLLDWKL